MEKTTVMKVDQEIESNISRIKALIRQKNEEISILKREISTLENEKWQFEDLRNIAQKNKNDED